MTEERISGYEIDRLIGAGGMGMVYLAKHATLQRRVAIKVLMDNLSANPQIVQRFIQEARLMGALNHPNIVTLYDFTTEPKLSLIMEFVDGRGLDQMIGDDVGPIPWEKALPMFIQILDGIGYAHSKGIIHRDIKPANILISKEGIVKITDLGIAKIAGQQGMTRTGTQMGTLYYESPEQITGAKDVDHRTDIYALGMTLYEMLAGRLPFETDGTTTEFAIMSSIVNRNEHLDPRKHYPHIPEWLVKTIQKATHLDVGKRFENCDVFKKVMVKYGDITESQNDYWPGRVGTATEANELPISVSSGTSSISLNQDQCPACNAVIREDMKFCDSCGKSLVKECPKCKSSLGWNKNFCSACGTDYKKWMKQKALEERQERLKNIQLCPACGAEVDIKENFCPDCGEALSLQCASCGFFNELDVAYCSSCGVNIQEVRSINSLREDVIDSNSFVMETWVKLDPGILTTSTGIRISIPSFEILATPVTQKMWRDFMPLNPSHFRGNNLPVESISVRDCLEFIEKRNSVDSGYHYRLLNQLDWEYACRAGSQTTYFWGDEADDETVNQYAWYQRNSNNATHEVAMKRANKFGLWDMNGNVAEICSVVDIAEVKKRVKSEDSYNFYKRSDSNVLCGGSWRSPGVLMKPERRSTILDSDSGSSIGFRLLRTAIL